MFQLQVKLHIQTTNIYFQLTCLTHTEVTVTVYTAAFGNKKSAPCWHSFLIVY